jgi:hypothetical protein
MEEKTSAVKEPRNEQSCGTKHLFYGFIQSMFQAIPAMMTLSGLICSLWFQANDDIMTLSCVP